MQAILSLNWNSSGHPFIRPIDPPNSVMGICAKLQTIKKSSLRGEQTFWNDTANVENGKLKADIVKRALKPKKLVRSQVQRSISRNCKCKTCQGLSIPAHACRGCVMRKSSNGGKSGFSVLSLFFCGTYSSSASP